MGDGTGLGDLPRAGHDGQLHEQLGRLTTSVPPLAFSSSCILASNEKTKILDNQVISVLQPRLQIPKTAWERRMAVARSEEWLACTKVELEELLGLAASVC